jgi:hypothetical protein
MVMVWELAVLAFDGGAALIDASARGVEGMDEMDDDMLSTCLTVY